MNASLPGIDSGHGDEIGSSDGPVPSPALPVGEPSEQLPSLPPVTVAARPVIAPLTPERYQVKFTVSKATHDKERHLQNLLCREAPDGDPAVIFDRALDLLTAQVEKKKLKAAACPRPPRPGKIGSRDVQAHVRRAIWKRDGGQCAFVGKTGRCTARRFLEWHHVQPFGHRGPATVENISLRCRAHNVYESELVFGRFTPRDQSGRRDSAPQNAAVSRENPPFRNGG